MKPILKSVIVFAVGIVQTVSAVNICNENLSDNHIIDGIPAYSNSKCENTSFSVFSNDGVNTSARNEGGWVRTQWDGGYQCTEYAHRYLRFKWDIKKIPNGNAGEWLNGTPPSGLEKSQNPVHGDIAVFRSGTYGHVAVVDVVDGNNMAIVEQNWNYGRYRRTLSIRDADGFLHVTANNGNNTPTDSGANPNPGLPANICNQQSVSDGHTVDGIPAYDQCGNDNGVWSDDGIHTRDHASSGWVRTQWSGGYQCTEFAFRYLRFKWGIQSAPKGDAGEWCRGSTGLTNTDYPVHGDVAVFAANTCGAGSYGHVAVVDAVNGNTVSVVEQNWGSPAKGNRRNVDLSCARCFLHAELNTSGTTAAVSAIGDSRRFNGLFDARARGNTVTIHLSDELTQNTIMYLHDLSGKRVVNLRITNANNRQFILKPGVGVFVLTVKRGESVSSRKIVLVK